MLCILSHNEIILFNVGLCVGVSELWFFSRVIENVEGGPKFAQDFETVTFFHPSRLPIRGLWPYSLISKLRKPVLKLHLKYG